MDKVVLKKDKKQLMFKDKIDLTGYVLKPKIKSKDIVIKEITIIDNGFIEKIIIKKLNNQIKKVTTLVFDILTQSEPNPMLLRMGFDSINNVRSLVLDKYVDNISKIKKNTYLKKLLILENELKKKNFSTITKMFTKMNLMEKDNNEFIR